MYNGLVHAHSGLRWIAIFLLVFAIIKFFSGKAGNKTFSPRDKKTALFSMIVLHLQLLIGLVLYFMGNFPALMKERGMGDTYARFYGMEHILMMVIAIALITFGYSSAKRMSMDSKKFSRLSYTYLIGFILIMAAIPWPFREALGASWF